MLKRSLLLLVLTVSAASLSAQVALAHKTSVFAHAHGKEIHGEVMADGGAPMSGAKITAYGPSGETLGETVADDKGEFTLTVTQRCDWKIVASGGGHQASYIVPMDELPTDLPTGPSDAHDHAHGNGHTHDDGHAHSHESEQPVGEDADLHRQVTALRGDIEELRNKLRWQDIIGGVGYILGLMGIAFYFLGQQRGERFPPKRND